MIPIIKAHCPKDFSAIYSDSHRSYNSLTAEGYNHDKVNHSLNFVNPLNENAHT